MPKANVSSVKICQLEGEELHLSPDKAIYWRRKKALLIADLHIGKVSHFRKNNIPIPQGAAEKNFLVLERLILTWKPKVVYFLGDLFHSFYNKEWEQLTFILAKYPKTKYVLITGNHDILKEEHYDMAGIKRISQLGIGPFMMTHHPEKHEGYYNLCGHIHPGVRLKGEGRQYIKLSCFYFGSKRGILPAFGSFTGTMSIQPEQGDQIFAIFNDQIMQLDTEKKDKD